ncbi:M15 family metallopeptidase [Dactylosporangium sp. NPDC049742]|uniref:M15 family metallopeptidase n=1 Tax=Dactylosporangium sp. NPDC049742 TaxID=3154737 RepID=UPI0034490A18
MRTRSRTRPVAAAVQSALASALVLGVLAGCGGGSGGTAASGAPPSPAVAASPSTAAPSAASPSAAGTPAFVGTVEVLSAEARQRMTGVSWRPGCPVGLDDLRLLRLSYVGFDGTARVGELVVHRAIADAVVRVFGRLYAARFPIRSMQTIEAYGGSDDASMAADNTSAFNCRNVPNTTHWSNHAYGRAIDVNTVENPYLPGKQIMPSAGKEYLDRRNVRPGMIVAGDVVVTAFKAEGFAWGGAWKTGVDYQHFEKPQ